MPVFEGKVTVMNKWYRENSISRGVLRHTQPPLLWESGAISLGVNQPERGTDHFTLVLRLRYMEQYLNSLIYSVEIRYRDSCGIWIVTINGGEL
jgi:hypothetical protein